MENVDDWTTDEVEDEYEEEDFDPIIPYEDEEALAWEAVGIYEKELGL